MSKNKYVIDRIEYSQKNASIVFMDIDSKSFSFIHNLKISEWEKIVNKSPIDRNDILTNGYRGLVFICDEVENGIENIAITHREDITKSLSSEEIDMLFNIRTLYMNESITSVLKRFISYHEIKVHSGLKIKVIMGDGKVHEIIFVSPTHGSTVIKPYDINTGKLFFDKVLMHGERLSSFVEKYETSNNCKIKIE